MKKTEETYFLRPAALIFAAMLCVLCYSFFDVPVTKYFEHTSYALRFIAKKTSFLIDADHQFFLWPSLYFGFRFLWKKELIANRCLLVVVSLPITNLLVGLIKFILGRPRPKLFFSSQQFDLTYLSTADAYQSMPSGHACTIGAICGAFACFYPKATLPLAILALLLTLGRVVLLEHYLSDIIAGVALGFFVSQWIYSVMRKNNIQFIRR